MELGGPQVFAGPPRAVAHSLQPKQGADIEQLGPALLRGQLPLEVLQHGPNVGVAAIILGRPFLGSGLGATFGAALGTAGAAGRTGGTLGGCGRCSIPVAGNCSSTQRCQATGHLSRSPSIFHLDVENARSDGAMFSATTRQKASCPLCLRKRAAAERTTVPWRYSAVPPSPLRMLSCRASRSAGRTVIAVSSARS